MSDLFSSGVRDAFDFTGTVVMITGGAGVLGPRFAEAFLARGARVALTDINAETLEQTVERLRAQAGSGAGEIEGFRLDVADASDVASVVDAICNRFGGIKVLLNNAAYLASDFTAFFKPFEEYDLDEWRRVMSVNIDGMFLVAQAVGRKMVAAGQGGAVIQTSSIYGLAAADNRIYEGAEYLGSPINNPAVYAASKAAVIGLSRWLSVYWAEAGIRVNTIAPGGVFSGQNDEFQARYGARVPMGRMARDDEMTSTVLYLASPASSYVTGQCIAVDGGLTAW